MDKTLPLGDMMKLKKKWANFVKVMFTGKFCSQCGKYDAILTKKNYPEFHYSCPDCGHEWVEIDSLLNQWIEKRKNLCKR